MDKDELKAIEAIRELVNAKHHDPERIHCRADDILILFLRQKGYVELAKAWEDAHDLVGFWYA